MDSCELNVLDELYCLRSKPAETHTMETAIGRKRKERTHTPEAEEEKCVQRKKILHTTLDRKRKELERTHTSEEDEEEEEEEENRRQTKLEKSKIDVSFSKRRKGLLGKAARLCDDFNDTRMAVLVVSRAGRPYAFGHSSVDEVLNDLYHIQPTTTKSIEGHNLMRQQHERKKLMGVKEEIEEDLRACQTVEEQAALRQKYLKLDEDIKERLRNWSSQRTSFEGGMIDQENNINVINVADKKFSKVGSFTTLNGDCGEGCCLGLGNNGIGANSFLASTESNYGVHDGDLTINGDNIDGCSLGLWYEDGGNCLSYLTTGVGGNPLSSTTSNYFVDGDLRLNGSIDCERFSLGLWPEVSDDPLRDSITNISGNAFLASVTSIHGDDGDLRSNGDIDAEGGSLRLWPEVSDDPLRVSTTNVSGNVVLPSTTSNHGICGDLRSSGDIDGERCSLGSWYEVGDDPLRDSGNDTIGNFLLLASSTSNDSIDWSLGLNTGEAEGCSLQLGHEVKGNSLADSTTGSGDFDLSSLPSVCSSTNINALGTVEPTPDFLQSKINQGYYRNLMEMEGVMESDY